MVTDVREKFKMSIFDLPWHGSGYGYHPARDLASYLSEHDSEGNKLGSQREPRDVTVGDVMNLFWRNEGKYLPHIKGYAHYSLAVTRKVFRKAGLELPRARIRR